MPQIYTDPVSLFYQYVSRKAEMSLSVDIKQINLSDIDENMLPGALLDIQEDFVNIKQIRSSDLIFRCSLKYQNIETIAFARTKKKARANASFGMAIYLKILKPSDTLPICMFQFLKEYIKQHTKPKITWSSIKNVSYKCDMIYDSKHISAEGKSKKDAKEAVCKSMLNLIVNGDNHCN
ncbi:hypothetical protein [Neodiprion abietis nucleopolyhedrovirus]|uniref:DRBM domain-containing protein n=1 Tax=Neodiprion abietis nucleopolyhedrovirus TaxID=204507 RepID=Q0ZP29_9CBAC|nr:hypothetical protein [Neodiprion abietis nucleopolyhedrovirus]ABC74925.1 unknown [Neodiprion abietis nucleopolyhedrovirus]